MTRPRLLLLNGPPGSGKSTLARRYAAEHPRTAVVDVDAVRAGLDHPDPLSDDAGLAARAVALDLARAHLLRGDDVLVLQLLVRPAFVEALERLAARATSAERPEHELAAGLLAARGGPASLARCLQQLAELVVLRPGTHVVRATDDPYRAVVALLARPVG